jgi:hypothetical protein
MVPARSPTGGLVVFSVHLQTGRESMKNLLGLILILTLSGTAAAEEGMWKLDQLDLLNLEGKGLQIEVKDIYSPDGNCLADATVLLGGGTSAFVSPNGLMLTNHHVAYGGVQRASTQGTDYLTNGFLARSYDEEIQAPGVEALVLQDVRDVTDEVLKAAKGVKDVVKRQRAIDKKIQAMTAAIEKGSDDVEARIASMYNGKEYQLYVYKRIEDIRVVYMPPMAIGNYGGEIDNWMWPRHTGDFAFARAYVSPDGVGRKYDSENVPYPTTWLRVSTGDLDPGDLAFTLGFPGSTSRYRTHYSAAYWYELDLPKSIQRYEDGMAILDEAGKDSPEAAIKVAGFMKGLANVHKNFEGMLAAMTACDFVKEREREDQELTAFINSAEKTKKQYGDVLSRIGELYEIQRAKKDHDDALELFGRMAGTLTSVANNVVYAVKEREKPDKERDPNFSEDDLERQISRLDSRYMSYYEHADKMLLKYALEKAAGLPDETRIKGLDYILKDPGKSIGQWVDDIYDGTKLADLNHTKPLFHKTSRELEASDDPLIHLALAIYPENDARRHEDERFGAELSELRKKYGEALSLWKGGIVYPDANRTMRFSCGTIKGYKPRDAVSYSPFTTLEGVMEKDTGEEPFNAPPKLKELYAARDFGRWEDPDLGDVPVAFLVDCDGTGGSSGSPVLNAKGEMIGIAFDGVMEARLGDWKFDPAVAREICVDMRYVLFVTDKYAGADYLLKEMGVL